MVNQVVPRKQRHNWAFPASEETWSDWMPRHGDKCVALTAASTVETSLKLVACNVEDFGNENALERE